MKRLQSFLMLALVLSAAAMLASCDIIASPIPPVPDGWTPLTGDQLQQEYDSARAIVDTRTRDNSMKVVAVNAADSNAPNTAIRAINAITLPVERDDAARYCADRFDRLGNRVLAEQFVGMISNIHLRDKTNRQLSSHPTGTDMPATLP